MSRQSYGRARCRAFLLVVVPMLVLAFATPVFAADGTFLTKWGSLGSGNTQFNRPHDVVIDSSGNVYVVDASNNRVIVFDSAGSYLRQWAVPNGGTSWGIGIDGANNIYVANDTTGVYKFTSAGAPVAPFTPQAVPNARDVAVDFATGDIYVTRQGTGVSRIRKLNQAGVTLAEWTTDIVQPRCIVVAPVTGDVYYAEYATTPATNRVTQRKSDGTLVRHWGSGGSGDGQFSGDIGMGLGPDGSVYVTEYLNNRIQRFTSDGSFMVKWGTSGSANGQFNGVRGVAINPVTDRAYVADTDNNRIQVFGDTPPAAAVTNPSAGAVTGNITITATATDANGIAKVEFYVDGVLLSTDVSGPYEAPWDTTSIPAGSHTITVKAYDNAGNSTVSAPVAVTTPGPPVEHVSTGATGAWSVILLGVAALGVTGLSRRVRVRA